MFLRFNIGAILVLELCTILIIKSELVPPNRTCNFPFVFSTKLDRSAKSLQILQNGTKSTDFAPTTFVGTIIVL
jgi:hypothetical protein